MTLTFTRGKALDFGAAVIQILPTSLWTASVFRQGLDGVCVPIAAADLVGQGDVKELTYRLTAWSEAGVVFEDYRHKIDHKLLLASTGISRRGSVKLFEVDSLNAVLRTKAFPGAKCLQFIC